MGLCLCMYHINCPTCLGLFIWDHSLKLLRNRNENQLFMNASSVVGLSFYLNVSPALSLKTSHPKSSLTRISPDRKHVSPFFQTSLINLLRVAFESAAYPSKSRTGWLRWMRPTNSPGSPGPHRRQRPFASRISFPVSRSTLMRPRGRRVGKSTETKPTAPTTFS